MYTFYWVCMSSVAELTVFETFRLFKRRCWLFYATTTVLTASAGFVTSDYHEKDIQGHFSMFRLSLAYA